nr:hypothetical protein [Tanacetum cinerariifolium]
MAETNENTTIPPTNPPTHQAHHTLSTIKIPILKKGEYDIWAMKIEHYLEHTDYPIWEVIQKGNGHVQVSTDTHGQIREAIKSRFGGNDESEKKRKYFLKQQFESFSVSNSEGLDKGYDRFQSLLSQLETHGAGVSTEDANQKFLRSLPSSRSKVSLIMRTKPGVDTLNFDDIYNNLIVFEYDVKGSTISSSSSHNVAFVSSENTSSTNEVNTAYGGSTSSGHNSQKEGSSSYNDDLMYPFFSNQSSGLQLDHDDLDIVKLSALIATIHGTLLESANPKGIKTIEGEMQETLATRQGIMEIDMQNRMNIKLWSLLMEKVLIGPVMLKMRQRNML